MGIMAGTHAKLPPTGLCGSGRQVHWPGAGCDCTGMYWTAGDGIVGGGGGGRAGRGPCTMLGVPGSAPGRSPWLSPAVLMSDGGATVEAGASSLLKEKGKVWR
jgi:hypothetical protein